LYIAGLNTLNSIKDKHLLNLQSICNTTAADCPSHSCRSH